MTPPPHTPNESTDESESDRDSDDEPAASTADRIEYEARGEDGGRDPLERPTDDTVLPATDGSRGPESRSTADLDRPGEPDGPSSSTAPDSTANDRDGPLGELASAVDERAADRADRSNDDGTAAFDELFEREDVTAIDRDRLWERLENEDSLADLGEPEREIREIEKHNYCHQCEYFAEPPAVGCTHDGTDILELASLDRFRVADCPVVLEDEELERQY